MMIVTFCFMVLPFFLTAMEITEVPVRVSVFSARGKKEVQEDRLFAKTMLHNGRKYDLWGVADGHAGHEVSQMIKHKYPLFFEEKLKKSTSVEESLRYACSQCDELAKGEGYQGSGSTLLVSCFARDSGVLSTLSLGDSRLLFEGEFLTSEHNCANTCELERVIREGGRVANGKLNGMIEVTRSLGDAFAKTRISQLISEPEYKEVNVYGRYDDEVLQKYGCAVLATDGFWGKVEEFEMYEYLLDAKNSLHEDFYKKYPNTFGATRSSVSDDELASESSDVEFFQEEEGVNYIARRLAYIAISHKGSRDNVAVIVALIGSHPDFSGESSESDSVDQDITVRQASDLQKLIEKLQRSRSSSPGSQNGDVIFSPNSSEEELDDGGDYTSQEESVLNEDIFIKAALQKNVGTLGALSQQKEENKDEASDTLRKQKEEREPMLDTFGTYKFFGICIGAVVVALILKYYKNISFTYVFGSL